MGGRPKCEEKEGEPLDGAGPPLIYARGARVTMTGKKTEAPKPESRRRRMERQKRQA